ncbi:MAG: endonuclease [Bdellovibrionota bacterium]
MKFLILFFTLINLNVAFSKTFVAPSQIQLQVLPLYYGSEFLAGYQNHSLKNEELKNKLFLILSGGHIKNANAADTITPSCNTTNLKRIFSRPLSTAGKCIQHLALGYDKARRALFGQLYLKKLDNNTYSVTDVYCEKIYTDADFGGALTFGPGLVPNSGNIINTEHTWPQSRFTGRFSRDLQKSDLHHLFPTDSEMNARRGSLRFGNVARDLENLRCAINRTGTQAEGGVVFQVPKAQQGNTARAIFYFATRYQMKISPSEEKALRVWNIDDPVDAEELSRNQQIETLQGNRNPYVDFTDLVDRIESFQ